MIVRLKVRQFRLMRGMEQHDLAQAIGVEQPYISKIENGHKYPNIVTLCRIKKALHCGLDDLVECIE